MKSQPTLEPYSCPGSPGRKESFSSLQVTPQLTPSTSLTSFVSSDFSDFNTDLSPGNFPGFSNRDPAGARSSLGMFGDVGGGIMGDIGGVGAVEVDRAWCEGEERSRVCYDIEKYLKSLEDVDYLDLSEPITPVSLADIKLGESSNLSPVSLADIKLGESNTLSPVSLADIKLGDSSKHSGRK